MPTQHQYITKSPRKKKIRKKDCVGKPIFTFTVTTYATHGKTNLTDSNQDALHHTSQN